jgi:DNA-binding MarR family transcriptional regulator
MRMEDQQPLYEAASALAADLRALVGKLKRRLREQAHDGDLTASQISALVRLDKDGPLTVTALARAEGVRPQSMGPTISALEDAGHVGRAPDPLDARQTLLSLTPRCRDWIAASRTARQDWLVHAILGQLAPIEQRHLASAIELLKRLVDA